MKTTNFLSGVLGVALSCKSSLYFPGFDTANRRIVGNAVSAQDYATHGRYTEPSTGITFYTSTEVNGTVDGDGDMSTVSLGGFTFGTVLPANAATVDTYEYIGLIVCAFE
jgi:cellobiose dehydrogenase (acceptor)